MTMRTANPDNRTRTEDCLRGKAMRGDLVQVLRGGTP